LISLEVLAALAVYSLATTITPGPNNLMLLASGVNFGFRRTIPHMLGISLGFVIMAIPVGLGLGALFMAVPGLHLMLKVAAGVYMLYLAWRIASASVVGEARANARPLTFLEAAAFQWVNPKAVLMAMTAMTTYTNPQYPVSSVILVACLFGLINGPSVSTWALFGAQMRNYLSDPKRLRVFNISMGVLLALSLWPMLRG
jgi:threonine/homoserine/homoserine lactone efflux protein